MVYGQIFETMCLWHLQHSQMGGWQNVVMRWSLRIRYNREFNVGLIPEPLFHDFRFFQPFGAFECRSWRLRLVGITTRHPQLSFFQYRRGKAFRQP